MADGKTVKYIIEYVAQGAEDLEKKQRRLKNTMDEIDGTMKKAKGTSKDLENSNKSLASSFARLAIRAAVVAPIWLAIRSAMMSLINTFQSGIKYIRDLDDALAKARAVTQGVTDVDAFIVKLRANIERLALETGKNVGEVTEIFYRFAETGLDAETALTGMNTALKLSVGTMTDTGEVARMLVDLFNMFGDTMDKNLSVQGKMDTLAGTFAVLWKENAGNLGEYIHTMNQFAPVAKSWGLSVQQMMVLGTTLNTFMQRGGSAGTQLNRAFQEMTKNLDKVELTLNKNLRGKGFNYFDVFMELLEQVRAKAGVTSSDLQTMLSSIFGERSMKGVAGLASGLEKLKDTFEDLDSKSLEDLKKAFEDLYNIRVDTINVQLDRTGQIMAKMVASFIDGASAGQDWVDWLHELNIVLETSIPLMKDYGDHLHNIYLLMKLLTMLSPIRLGLESIRDSRLKALDDTKDQIIAKLGQTKGSAVFREIRDKMFPEYANKKEDTESDLRTEAVKNALKNRMSDKTTKPPIEDWNKFFETVRNGSKFQLQLLDTLKGYGISEVDLEKTKLKWMQENSKSLKDQKEIADQYLKVQKAITNEIVQYSTKLQGAFKNSVAEFFKGNITGQEAFQQFADNYADIQIDAISEGLSQLTVGKTGMGMVFGDITNALKGFASGGDIGNRLAISIESASQNGSMMFYNAIVNASNTISTSSGDGVRNYGGGGGGASNGNFNWGKLLGGGLNSAMAGYAGYRRGGVMSGIMGGVGSALMTFGGPYGAVVGGALSLASMLFGIGRKKKTTIDVQERSDTLQIASKIDVTNKQLQVVNRNLVALRQDFRTFILPESAYFSEGRGIADSFSISARRGLSFS